jgi:uncharacterized protein
MHVNRMCEIEDYARQMMEGGDARHRLAHDYKHADRVRRWAVRIADEEGYERGAMVEAAALLHDVGLAVVTERGRHAEEGAGLAAEFLLRGSYFSEGEIEEIARAIRAHSWQGEGGPLGDILRDADMLDMFGPVGLMRALTSQSHKPDYDQERPQGETWGLRAEDFTRRFAEGRGTGPTIVDQINFQISCYDNLATGTARRLALPLVEYMRSYLVELARQIAGT